jgi:hypothetical protein
VQNQIVNEGCGAQIAALTIFMPLNAGLAPSGKSMALMCRDDLWENGMRGQCSDLVEISKLNGDFRKNYGKLIGAYLYLRSISAARGRSLFWTGFISIVCSAALTWLARHGLISLRIG